MNFLFLSITDWDAPQFGSRQQVAKRLVQRGHRVLFVDVPRALHSFISDPGRMPQTLRRMNQLRQIPEGPLVYTPPLVFPIYYNPVTNGLNQRLLLGYLRHTLKRIGWSVDVLWTYWANTAYLVGRFQEKVSVYHCIDNFTAVSYPLTPPGTIARMEAEQCRQVDLVLARTAGLAADKRQYNSHTIHLPGGADTDQFDPQYVTETLPDMAHLPQPRIGFIGTFDDRVNVSLLHHCISQLPEASFIFVGPVRSHLADISRLQSQANVRFLPPCPHTAVPAVIAGFDICLIPYYINEYTQELSPIKLYEYLAMSKPIVATNLPYIAREQEHVRLAETPAQFLACLQEALAQPPTIDEKAAWREAAVNNSWDSQVDQIEDHLKQIWSKQA